ncbi:aminotransferase class I/II-fold pyridoxal phosphate-dependent enzyme [Croceivirga sp. JEA036]|uniref:aminotransferase class I/II-fold pyridoxal phosphate-dependent enzyme n=1 Tax=Croceivirga sp. JEA036 TaxID=2721162 RepID=UPI00143A3D0B|nr:8-amino-7-oxononanoate synthase [Croceivirga sp. JEA036]NJB36852.1 8-amino-7-oxononanoate synthase [Croceivirga sp. JEA036]
MQNVPKKLKNRLEERARTNSLRKLSVPNSLVDFSSNDYLGFGKTSGLESLQQKSNGAGGSRLLSGNHEGYIALESYLSLLYNQEAALVFNSGYDANLGFFAAVPQKGDVVLYDALSHASIRDGILLSNAQAFKFRHNDLNHLKERLEHFRKDNLADEIYVVTESVFSMDGDSPDLVSLCAICNKFNALVIVDEAHAVGVFGLGLLQQLGISKKVFAQIITFGKALGSHGAAILGSTDLKSYLVNFCRSLIYTTALSEHATNVILQNFKYLRSAKGENCRKKLLYNIAYFKTKMAELELTKKFITSDSAIQALVLGNLDKAKTASENLRVAGFDVRPILAPTVPKGAERLRFCIHSYNSKEEIKAIFTIIKKTIDD